MSIIATTSRARKVESSTVLFSSVGSRDHAASQVRRAMFKLGYDPRIQEEVYALVRRDGDLTEAIDSGRIDSEDIEALTNVLETAFDVVDIDSPEWDADDDEWSCLGDDELPPSQAEIDRAFAIVKPKDVPSFDDSIAFAVGDGRFDVRYRLTTEDWAEYQRWSEWRDQAYCECYQWESEAAEIGRPVRCS